MRHLHLTVIGLTIGCLLGLGITSLSLAQEPVRCSFPSGDAVAEDIARDFQTMLNAYINFDKVRVNEHITTGAELTRCEPGCVTTGKDYPLENIWRDYTNHEITYCKIKDVTPDSKSGGYKVTANYGFGWTSGDVPKNRRVHAMMILVQDGGKYKILKGNFR